MGDNQRIIVLPRRFKTGEDLPAIVSTRYRCGDFVIEEEAFGDHVDYWWGLTYCVEGPKGRELFYEAVGTAYFRTDMVLAQGHFEYKQSSPVADWGAWRERHFNLPRWIKTEYFVYFYTDLVDAGPMVIRCRDEKMLDPRTADKVLRAARFMPSKMGKNG